MLPLKDLKPGPGSDWIGAGTSETLTTKLADVRACRRLKHPVDPKFLTALSAASGRRE